MVAMTSDAKKRACAEEDNVAAEKKLRTSEPEVELDDDSWADKLGSASLEDDSWADEVGAPKQPSPCTNASVHVAKDVEARKPLEHLEGAMRDTRPAWMTKGEGVGKEIFGEPTGDAGAELVKPGLTRADLDAIKDRGLPAGPDPFGEVYRERKETPQGAAEKPVEQVQAASADGKAIPEVTPVVAVPPEGETTDRAAAPAGDAAGVAPAKPAEAENLSESLTVCVKNLNENVEEEQFELDFEAHGEIDELKFLEGRGIAFVTFATRSGVEAALRMNGDEYYGKKLSVALAREKDQPAKQWEAFAKGLPSGATEESVKTHFSSCGAIVRVKLRFEEGRSKGSAFIVFETQAALTKALEMDGQKFQDEQISVVVANQNSKGKGKDKGKAKGKGKGKDKGKGKGKKGKGKGRDR